MLACGCAGVLRNHNKCPREVASSHDVTLLYQLTSHDILRLQDIGLSCVTFDDLASCSEVSDNGQYGIILIREFL